MFKNFTVQTKLVRAKKANQESDENITEETTDIIEIAQILADTTVKTVGAIAIILAANKVLSTVCDIAVVAAKAKIK